MLNKDLSFLNDLEHPVAYECNRKSVFNLDEIDCEPASFRVIKHKMDWLVVRHCYINAKINCYERIYGYFQRIEEATTIADQLAHETYALSLAMKDDETKYS